MGQLCSNLRHLVLWVSALKTYLPFIHHQSWIFQDLVWEGWCHGPISIYRSMDGTFGLSEGLEMGGNRRNCLKMFWLLLKRMHFLELQFLIGSVSLQEADTDLEMRTGVVTLQQLLQLQRRCKIQRWGTSHHRGNTNARYWIWSNRFDRSGVKAWSHMLCVRSKKDTGGEQCRCMLQNVHWGHQNLSRDIITSGGTRSDQSDPSRKKAGVGSVDISCCYSSEGCLVLRGGWCRYYCSCSPLYPSCSPEQMDKSAQRYLPAYQPVYLPT